MPYGSYSDLLTPDVSTNLLSPTPTPLPPPTLAPVENVLAPQTQTRQPGPLGFGMAFGDSIAALQINHGAGGVVGPRYNSASPAPFVQEHTAGVGDPPERVLARLNSALQQNPDFFKNNSPTAPLFLSPGTSNNPAQLQQVQQILDRLKAANVGHVVVPGVGPGVANSDQVNQQLRDMVTKAGFTYYDPSNIQWLRDGVHPRNAVDMQQGALAAFQPTSLVPTGQQPTPLSPPTTAQVPPPAGTTTNQLAPAAYSGPHADIYNFATAHGVNPNLALTTASIESRFGAIPDRPGSQYGGMFQLGSSEWNQMGGGNRADVNLQIDHGVRLLAQRQQELADSLNRTPTDSEVYLAHQQGVAGATALINNPNMTAAQALTTVGVAPGDAARRIAGNGGDPNAPASQFVKHWSDQYDQHLANIGKLPAYAGAAVTPRTQVVTGGQPPETTSRRPSFVLSSPQTAAGQDLRNAFAPGGGQPTTEAQRVLDQQRQRLAEGDAQFQRQQRIMQALGIARAIASGVKFTPVNYDPHKVSQVPPWSPMRLPESKAPQVSVPEPVRRPVGGTRATRPTGE